MTFNPAKPENGPDLALLIAQIAKLLPYRLGNVLLVLLNNLEQ